MMTIQQKKIDDYMTIDTELKQSIYVYMYMSKYMYMFDKNHQYQFLSLKTEYTRYHMKK